MSITPSSIVDHDPNFVEKQVLAGINQHSNSLTGPSKLKNRKPEIVCLIRPTSKAKCRSCLTQYSESPYFGEFHILNPVKEMRKLILQIFSSRKSVEDIISFCLEAAACPSHVAQISGKVCEPLIGDSPLREIPLNEGGDLYISPPNAKNLLKARTHLNSLVPFKQQCFKTDTEKMLDLRERMYCTANAKNGVAVELQSDIEDGTSYQYFSTLIPEGGPSNSNKPCSDYDEVVFPAPCNKRSAEFFYILPAIDQFPYWVSPSHVRALQFGPIRHPTRCVWAEHVSARQTCSTCIKKLRAVENEISDNTNFSPRTSLHFLRGGIADKRLSSCAKHRTCQNVLFVPEFICEYEFDQEKNLQKEQQAAERLTTSSVVRNEAKQKTTVVSGLVTSGRIRGPIGSAKAARLIGDYIDHSSEVMQTSRIHSAPTRKPATSAAKGTRVSENPCLERNFMVVQYEFDDQKTCLQSLALEHDVLMVSVTGRYVWMICEPEENLHGGGCKDLTILLRLQRNVDMLRSLTAIRVAMLIPKQSKVRTNKAKKPNHIIAEKRKRNARRAKSAEIVEEFKGIIDPSSDDEGDEDDEDDEDYEDSPSHQKTESAEADTYHFFDKVPRKKRTPMEIY